MANELTSIERARELVLERMQLAGGERVPLREALGRVLAEPVAAADSVPGFDNSAMDGYAVLASDTAGASATDPRRLTIVDESRAGHPAAGSLAAGEAIAISTGAMLPEGADSIARVEDTTREGDEVLINAEIRLGTSIRRIGEDIRAGDEVVSAGARIGAAELGVLAAIGVADVACARRPTLAVLLTGDELIEPGAPLAPGQIRDSNAYSVPPLGTGAGADVISIGIARDDPEETVAALRGALGGRRHGDLRWRVRRRTRPRSAGARVAGRRAGLLGSGPASRQADLTSASTPAGGWSSGCPGTRSRQWSPSSSSRSPSVARDAGLRPGCRHGSSRASPKDLPEGPWASRGRSGCGWRSGPDGWLAHPTGPQGSHVLTSMLGADGLAFAPTERDALLAGELDR